MPTAKIAIVTDSTAALPDELVERYGITVTRLEVIFNGKAYRDGVDLSSEQFYKMLAASKTLPTTSQPPVGEMEAAYRGLLERSDIDGVVGIHVSATLSGTYNSARTIAERMSSEFPGKKVTAIDSQSAFMGTGFVALEAARAAESGKGYDEIVSLVKDMIPRVQALMLVDTLEYLQKGGRIGAAQAFLGGLLNIKPILRFREGRLEPLERARTRRKGMERLVATAVAATGGRPCRISVGHAQAPEDAETLARMLRDSLNVVEEIRTELPATVAVHLGPGVLGFAFKEV